MQRIKSLREKKGISQEKLAEMTGLSRVSISNLENGKTLEVKVSTLRKIALALGVSVEFFLP